jgi:hypothetical protein
VLDELGEHALEMTLVSDEQPVEAFPARGANEPVGCKHRIPTPRSTKIARTGSGCQEASTRSPVIHFEVKCVGNDIDVTRRGHGIASKQQAFR